MGVKRVFEGLTLVTVGGILLANTTGVLPWSVWLTILLLWPLLVVSLGIDILGRALNSPALRVLASLVVIGGLVYGALAGAGRVQMPAFGIAGTSNRAFSLSEPIGAATMGRAEVSAGLASVKVRAGGTEVTAQGETPFGAPEFRITRSGGAADVRIASPSGGGTVVVPGSPRSFLDARLPGDLLWERIRVDSGLSEVSVDVVGLPVRELDVNTGLSNTTITFGEATAPGYTAVPYPSEMTARVSGGLSAFTLRVPPRLGVEIVADNGLGSVHVPSGWTRVAGDGPFQGTWRSDGYDTSTSKLRVEVKTGLSSVDVQRY